MPGLPCDKQGPWTGHSGTHTHTHTHTHEKVGAQPTQLSLCLTHSAVSDSATPWTVAHQAPLSMGFSRQEYWSVAAPVERCCVEHESGGAQEGGSGQGYGRAGVGGEGTAC